MKHIETDIQRAVVVIARHLECKYPEIALLYHIQNGGKRTVQQAVRAKEMGELPGVPDLCLPIPNGIYSSLYLELKKPRGRLTESQKKIIPLLRIYGNRVVVCYSVDDAITEIVKYIKTRRFCHPC